MAPGNSYARLAKSVSRVCGRPKTFALATGVILVWIVTGPIFGFSDTWQLVINTGTTIITFLMVFLIQNTQNRDNAAIQAKLDELIKMSDADNAFIGIEHLTDEELQDILETVEKDARNLHAERHRRGRQKGGPARKPRTRARAD